MKVKRNGREVEVVHMQIVEGKHVMGAFIELDGSLGVCNLMGLKVVGPAPCEACGGDKSGRCVKHCIGCQTPADRRERDECPTHGLCSVCKNTPCACKTKKTVEELEALLKKLMHALPSFLDEDNFDVSEVDFKAILEVQAEMGWGIA